jgi:hypothetical protein
MTKLNDTQLNYLREQVNLKGVGKFTFETATATDADKQLSVAALFTDGKWHTTTVKVGDNSNWLTNDAQFKNVVKAACDNLGRP